jgi:lipopolysaccharide/colanic/teichoic acid biosynthesis glycosyltransferase
MHDISDSVPSRVRPAENADSEIADEALYYRVLALERRRTERTGDPFLLMLLDFSDLQGEIDERKIAGVCGTIGSEARETDVIGWYRHPVVVGVLFTALRITDQEAIQSALLGKTSRALQACLGPEDLKKMIISFHFFPEETGKPKTTFRADEDLYPDIKHKDKLRCGYHTIKWVMDIAGSLFGILLFSPIFMAVALLIRLTSKGPVLFRQRRIGRYGREFECLKFRTMFINNDPAIHQQYVAKLIQQGAPTEVSETNEKERTFKIVNDPRVTSIGRFLRKTSLDELPQLFNVLRGEMSLVGPRPPIPYEIACYRYWHRRRIMEVKPGITGLWQVTGRSRTTFDDMVRLDLRYVREQSIWFDLKLIFKTPLIILSGAGAY